jgi:hypothetical protein
LDAETNEPNHFQSRFLLQSSLTSSQSSAWSIAATDGTSGPAAAEPSSSSRTRDTTRYNNQTGANVSTAYSFSPLSTYVASSYASRSPLKDWVESPPDRLAKISLGGRIPTFPSSVHLNKPPALKQNAPARSPLKSPSDPHNRDRALENAPRDAVTETSAASVTQKTGSGSTHEAPTSATSQGSRYSEKRSLGNRFGTVQDILDGTSEINDEKSGLGSASTDKSDELYCRIQQRFLVLGSMVEKMAGWVYVKKYPLRSMSR